MRKKKAKRPVKERGSLIRKRLIAAVLALVSSGFGLPYAWQGIQDVMQYFTALRSDVNTLKIDQAQLKGQVTQIQSDMEVIIGREMHGLAQRDAHQMGDGRDALPAIEGKEGAQ